MKPDETVAAQPVTLGPGDNQRVAVTKGLEPGQLVVTDGADRLKDGAKVRLAGGGAPPAGSPGGAQPAAEAPTSSQPGAASPTSEQPRGQRRRRGSE